MTPSSPIHGVDDPPPPKREELAALKMIAVYSLLVSFWALVHFVAIVDGTFRFHWIGQIGTVATMAFGPIGVGVARRSPLARTLFLWWGLLLGVHLFFFFPLLMWGFHVCFLMGFGGYLLQPRVRAFFEPRARESE